MPKFKDSVIKIALQIPKGKVASYGQVAAYAGYPRGARAVGWTLNKLPPETNAPWWRIINNKGYISMKGYYFTQEDFKDRLEEEGIKVSKNYEIDIEKYRWTPDPIPE